VFVPNLFAQPGVQPLVVRERFAALRPPHEGTRPYPVATAGDLAALVGRLRHLGPEDGPRFLLLQDRLAPGLDLPAGVEAVASGPGFRLLRMPDAASGRPSATATPASPLKAPWQSLP
jgi:hypothetical protein